MFCATAVAQDTVEYSATAIGVGATGDFAPYMIASWNHGKTTMNSAALLDVDMHKDLNLGERFSWAAGAEFLTGHSGSANYEIYDAATGWTTNTQSPAAIWLQQLYASVKWRGVFLTVGMKDRESRFVDNALSSGDLVQSNNARAIPQVRVGFVDYQDIPFTKGWAQIDGEISYGKMADSDYVRNHYNYYNTHIATDELYTFKRISFRSNPTKPFWVSVGMQVAGFFGGTTSWYHKGILERSQKNRSNLKAYWDMFVPSLNNGDKYFEGSSLGSYDFKAQYTLTGGHQVAAYFQWLWEDGSGMAKRNKTDGLWGVEYHRTDGNKHALQGIVAEYLDFRDQSGPLHWAPSDYPGTTITTEATGGDDYYNNNSYNSYANFGMALGSPFLVSPLYNLNGYPQYMFNRANGFHLAAQGWLSNSVSWKSAVSYSKSWGAGRRQQAISRENTSMLIECGWDAMQLLPGFSVKGQLAFDAGKLRGNNFGGLLAITYTGNFALKR